MSKELFNILNISSLKAIYLFSNTPMYLYKNFRKDPSVQELSDKYSADDLIDLFYQFANESDRNVENLVVIYSIIISLTYKEYQQVKVFFETKELYGIEWFEMIRDIFFSTSTATEFYELKGNQFDFDRTVIKSEESSDQIIVRTFKPEILVDGEQL